MGGERLRVLLGFAAFGAFWGTWGAVLPQVQAHARVDDGALGTALLFVGLGALASIRVAGGLADRFPRATMPVSLVIMAVTGVLPALVTGGAALAGTLLLLGLGSGAADAAINAAGARAETSGRPVLSLAHGAFSAAVVLGSLGAAAVSSDRAGRPWPLFAVAVLLVALAAVTAWLPVIDSPAVPTTEAGRSVDTGPGRVRWSRPLVVLGLLAALAYLVENAWQSWGAIHLHATLGASLPVAALAPAVFAACAATGRFGGHYLTRFPPGRLIGVGAGLAAAGTLGAAFAHSVPIVMLGIALAGFGTSVCAPTLIASAGRHDPSASGAATGTVITIAYLGFAVGPAGVGLLSRASTLPIALAAVAVVAAVLAIAGLRVQAVK